MFFFNLFSNFAAKTNTYARFKRSNFLSDSTERPNHGSRHDAFRERGIKAVKMDDIAQHLGISKRTLYEIYEDKEKLLYYCIVTYDRRRQAYMENYVNEGHNVIDVIVEAYRMRLKETRTVCPVFYEDIMKYPQVEQYLKDEHERMREGFVRFMQRGVEEGFLRSEINYQLVPIS